MGIGERRKPFVETKFFLLSPNPFPLSQKTFGTFCGRKTKNFKNFQNSSWKRRKTTYIEK